MIASEVPVTTICDLPQKLVEKILSKVPITSLGAVRCTCKRWNALSKEKVICKAGARRNEFVGFMVKNYRVCSVRFDLELADPSPSIKEIGNLFNDVEISKVLQCNGLLLCVARDNTRLVVWNPYLAQIRWIEPRTTYHDLDRYAIGYASNRKHKILRVLDDEPRVGHHVFGYEIFDLTSNSWRGLDITPNWDIQYFQRGVSLKGNTYFIAKEKEVEQVEGPEGALEPVDVLLCFDFTSESFGPFLPLPFPHYIFDTGSLSCLRDEKLAALYQDECRSPELQIWVTSNVEPHAVSWTLFLKVDLVPLMGYQLFDIEAASFFIDEEKKTAVVFHLDELSETAVCDTAYIIIGGKDPSLRRVALGEAVNHPGWPNFRGDVYSYPLVCTRSYLPSLVPAKLKPSIIKQPTTSQRRSGFSRKNRHLRKLSPSSLAFKKKKRFGITRGTKA